ncbi:MAG: HlyD family efflux transporter periplasmic adaptor subunit [Eubacteriales bacterium]
MKTAIENKEEKSISKEKVKNIPWKKYLSTTFCLSIVALGGIQGYSLFFGEEAPVALTGTVSFGQLGTVLEGSGSATSAQTQSIYTASNSEILGVYVTAGESVQEGQLLYIQDDSALDDEISAYEDEIEAYLASISDYNNEISDYYKEISDLEKEISSASVTAPFSGKITNVTISPADNVSSGNQLAQLTSSAVMKVVLYFSYVYEQDIQIGDKASVSIPDQMMTLTGEVTGIKKVEYITKEGTKCFSVTISVNNPNSLQEGTEVSATIGTIYPVEGGTLSNEQDLSINAPISGEVTEVLVDNYEIVTAGQVLFRLNTESISETIADYYNDIAKVESSISSLESKIADLEEDIAETEESRSEYKVFSEISGKIISVNVVEGNAANIVTPAVMIYNMDTMEMTANIDELDFEHVYQGMPVKVSYSTANSTETFVGEVTSLSFEATNESGVAYFPVTISIPSDGALSSGVSLSYAISVGEAEEGYLVPIDALKSYEEGTCVYIQGDLPSNVEVDDLPEGFYAQKVEVLSTTSQYALIKEGLEEDMVLFTRYQATAPTGGDSTSAMTAMGDMDMDAMMAMRESMMAEGGMMNGGTGMAGASSSGVMGSKRG